ncbi:MAG: ABC transporter ATP-binding protein [Syntrophorhabdales bacterium]
MDSVPLLSIQGLQAGYGDVPVLWDVSLEVRKREITGLVGGNGAGKSTLLNVISGGIPPKKGRIRFLEEDISRTSITQRVRLGITHIPEGRLLFSGLTVGQNLRLGAFGRKDKSNLRKDLDMVLTLFPRLAERKDQLAGTLSGGEQQMCAIGRGLMANPKLLLVDELSLGLAPIVVDQIMAGLKKAYNEGDISIVLVEQDVQLGLEFSHRAYVLETGRVVKEGKSEELAEDSAIRKAYLGI